MSFTVVDQRSLTSRIAAGTTGKGTKNVDCFSNSRFLGVVGCNGYVGRYRRGRFCRSVALDRKSGSRRPPVESKTFAIGLSSPCPRGTDSRCTRRHSLNSAVFWRRLVSRTGVLLRFERTVLPRSGHGDLGKVLSHGRCGAVKHAVLSLQRGI